LASASRWSLSVAPFAGLVYYLATYNGFSTAIGEVVADTTYLDPVTGATVFNWGTHWIYHTGTEVGAIAFGTFVAAGIVREGARLAGLMGGLGISLCWMAAIIAKILRSLFAPDTAVADKPWYEYLIGVISMLGAPIMGYRLGERAGKFSCRQALGFGGIPRLHFLWLWFPAEWYAAAMIGPLLNFCSDADGTFLFEHLYLAPISVLPLFAFAAPLLLGLGLISGQIVEASTRSSEMQFALRQIVGVLVLMIGWCSAAVVSHDIARLGSWLR